jgi:hypothetical protein
MKHEITWRRSIIGGEPLHHDFCACVDGNINIARIMLAYDSDRRPVWSCNMVIGNGASETCLSRREAIMWVEIQLRQFIEASPDTDPQEWVPDQRSIQLRYLKESDPTAYAKMVSALKAGALDRIQPKA